MIMQKVKSKAGVVDRCAMVLRVSIKRFMLVAEFLIFYNIRVQTCFNSADGFGGGPVGLGKYSGT